MSLATGAQAFSRALRPEHRARGFAQVAKRERAAHAKEHTGERLLLVESDPPIGAHIITQRHGYAHYRIDAGAGRVVHYTGLSHGLRREPVEEISLPRFAAGHRVSVTPDLAPKFERREVARRARSRIGEANYRLFTNNCEHFCEWCLQGQHRSQIEACLALPSRSLHVSRGLTAELSSLADRTLLRSTQASAGRATV
jgi:Lecithin retinol acyltransferase